MRSTVLSTAAVVAAVVATAVALTVIWAYRAQQAGLTVVNGITGDGSVVGTVPFGAALTAGLLLVAGAVALVVDAVRQA